MSIARLSFSFQGVVAADGAERFCMFRPVNQTYDQEGRIDVHCTVDISSRIDIHTVTQTYDQRRVGQKYDLD